MPRLLALVALGLVLWTLWLTVSLPSRHVAQNYDVAWIGFDLALAAAFGATAWSGFRRPRWLAALAAATGTMLVCDAWFDVVTSNGGGERLKRSWRQPSPSFPSLRSARTSSSTRSGSEIGCVSSDHRRRRVVARRRERSRKGPQPRDPRAGAESDPADAAAGP